MKINPAQRRLLEVYDGGEVARLIDLETNTAVRAELDDWRDPLLRFLFVELSTPEGCDSMPEAVRRLGMVRDQIAELIDALCKASPALWPQDERPGRGGLAAEHYCMASGAITALRALQAADIEPPHGSGEIELIQVCGDLAVRVEEELGGRMEPDAVDLPWCYEIHDNGPAIRGLYADIAAVAYGLLQPADGIDAVAMLVNRFLSSRAEGGKPVPAHWFKARGQTENVIEVGPRVIYLASAAGEETGHAEVSAEDLAKVGFGAGPGYVLQYLVAIDGKPALLGNLEVPHSDPLWSGDDVDYAPLPAVEQYCREMMATIKGRPGNHQVLPLDTDMPGRLVVGVAIPLAHITGPEDATAQLAAAFGDFAQLAGVPKASTAWVVQHEFDYEPTYVVNTRDEAQSVEFGVSIPVSVRRKAASALAKALSEAA